MRHKFTKNLGRVSENLELGFEEKWIYVHYNRGSVEKNACLLKNENKSDLEYLEGFFKENNVSEEMKKEVRKFFETEKPNPDPHWQEFTSFLMKTLSLNMVFGVTIAICVFGGYKLGNYLDARFDLYPILTLIFIIIGIGIGGATVYSMVLKYFKPSVQKNREKEKKAPAKEAAQEKQYPMIDVSFEQVIKAVRQFSNNLPKGVYRTILVKEDNSIDFKQLAHLLGGIPERKYYMSKETYDIFEEHEKHIPGEMDIVQKAVDLYVKEHNEYPMLPFDPERRVNYYQLIQDKYLKSAPEIQFYITDLDGLITHKKPAKKTSS
ncbi:AtpZ/AtpI family protein [Neobacillus sp. SAB-20_R2A]|uniref:AtpZ/AtpI family protein n=1 Tax=Neobacillus sp. SAB-20_R2A TaxID=3120519 RepID=UPI003C6DE48A